MDLRAFRDGGIFGRYGDGWIVYQFAFICSGWWRFMI